MNTNKPKPRFIKITEPTYKKLKSYTVRMGAKIGATADIAINAHIQRQSHQLPN